MYEFDARCIPRYILSINVQKGVFLVMASERYTRIWDAEKKTAVRIHRSDNRPENLRVLPSQGHHMALE